MTTKAATYFSARIRSLTEYHQRTLNGQPPSGLEIVNTLRYFQQTLLGYLKDVKRDASPDMWKQYCAAESRVSQLPSLTYAALYYAVANIIDIYPSIPSGQIALGRSILNTLKALYLFLEKEIIDQLPYNIACLLCHLPKEIHTEVMHLLCDVILPYVLTGEPADTYAVSSVPSVIMLVFMYSNEPSHHTWLLETLMSLQRNIYKYVLAVIACGPSEARVPAANLLFHYWPLLNPQILDRKPIQYRPHAWTPTRCQHRDCASAAQAGGAPGGGGPPTASSSTPVPGGNFNRQQTPPDWQNAESSVAVSMKKMYDAYMCAEVAESAPPIMLCKSCAETIQEQNYNKNAVVYAQQPMPTTNVNVCQNRGCQSSSRLAVSTCFSEDCIRAHQHVPIRLCQECHNAFHKDSVEQQHLTVADDAGDKAPLKLHIYHTRVPSPWNAPNDDYHNTIESIIKLLKETSFQLDSSEQETKRPKWMRKLEAGQAIGVELDEMADEKRMLSRYGIWLLVGLCTPAPECPSEAIGYLMSMVFQWFGTTALLPNDPMGAALEQLKTEFACQWLTQAIANHYDVFVQCLIPRPPEYAKVGGLWDKLSTRLEQIKEGLNKVLSLQPYDIISYETWHRIMPEWLETICNEVAEKDMNELKILMCKLFEPDLCTMSFSIEQTYHFIAVRLLEGSLDQQQQALDWLMLLSECEIAIPLDLLLATLRQGAAHSHLLFSQQQPRLPDTKADLKAKLSAAAVAQAHPIIVSRVDSIGDVDGLAWLDDDEARTAVLACTLTPDDSPIRRPMTAAEQLEDESGSLDCNAMFYATFIDIIHKQADLAELKTHQGFGTSVGAQLLQSMTQVMRAHWTGAHTCHVTDTDDYVDCTTCQQMLLFSEIVYELLERFCPRTEIKIESRGGDVDDEDDDEGTWQAGEAPPTAAVNKKHSTSALSQQVNVALDRPTTSKSSAPTMMAHADQHHEPDQYAGVLPSEEVQAAVAEAVTVSDADVGAAHCAVSSTQVAGDAASPHDPTAGGQIDPYQMQYWDTMQGRFRFNLADQAPELQLIYNILKDIEKHPSPDVKCYLLHCVKFLCLHVEALDVAHTKHRGFLIWAQENVFIPKLWAVIRSDFSQLAQVCVPLLLHCLTYVNGADAFWRLLIDQMTCQEWTTRFACVGKISQLVMFVDAGVVRGNQVLQSSIALAFSLFVSAVADPNAAVAQRATMLVHNIRPNSLKAMVNCMECQFDQCLLDRPLLLHRLYTLVCLLHEQQVLSMEFFLQRFDTLAMEAQQFMSQKLGDAAGYAQDLLHTDPVSDLYQRKMSRARRALENSDSVRSIIRHMHDRALPHQQELIINFELQTLKENDKVTRCCVCLHWHPASLDCSAAAEARQDASKVEAARRHGRRGALCPRCMTVQKGWHRCSVANAAALRAQQKIAKVVTLVKVMHAWKAMKRRLSTISSFSQVSASSAQSLHSMLSTSNTPVPESSSQPCLHRASPTTVIMGEGTTASQQPNPHASSLLLNLNRPPKIEISLAETPSEAPTSPTVSRSASGDRVMPACTLFEEAEPDGEQAETDEAEGGAGHWQQPTDLVSHYWGGQGDAMRRRLSRLSARRVQAAESYVDSKLDAGETIARMREFTDQESNFCLTLSRAMDHHWTERHTMFLTISLFMKYLSLKSTTIIQQDEKALAKKQNIVFRHLNTLLGFSTTESCFTIPPAKLRYSVVSNAFISNIPAVLDNNLMIGNSLLTITLSFLRYLPSPQKLASDNQPIDYTIHSLSKHVRHNWLWTLLLTLYKYKFNQPSISELIQQLMQIVLNSLDSSVHRCGKLASEPHPVLFSRRPGDSSGSDSDDAAAVSSSTRHSRLRARLSQTSGGNTHEHTTVIAEQTDVYVDSDEPTSEADASGLPVESRIKQQIDEFDRSFSKSEKSAAGSSSELPRVLVSAETHITRPELLAFTTGGQPTGAKKAGVPAVLTSSSSNPDVKVFTVTTAADLSQQQQQRHRQSVAASNVASVQMATPTWSTTTRGAAAAAAGAVSVPQSTATTPSVRQVQNLDAQVLHDVNTAASLNVCSAQPTADPSRRTLSPATGGRHHSGSVKKKHTDAKEKRKARRQSTRSRSAWQQLPAAPQQGDVLTLRCTQCNQPLQHYDEETLNLAIVCLSTYIQREPALAAECIPHALQIVARVSSSVMYSWQADSNIFVPGNSRSVARQFMRVLLHQLAPNALFLQLFQTHIIEPDFFKALVHSLVDFTEMSPVSVLMQLFEVGRCCALARGGQWLLQNLQMHWCKSMSRLMANLARYMLVVPPDAYAQQWALVIPALDTFLRRYILEMTKEGIAADFPNFAIIINCIFKVQNFSAIKGSSSLGDSFAKLISQALEMTPVQLSDLVNICTSCNRSFTKDRDRQCISRSCVNQLLQAVKFKINLPEANYLTLLNLILQDSGEAVTPQLDDHNLNTAAAECGRPYIQDFVDFVADLHVLNKIKSLAREMRFREDTLGGDLKAGLSQYVAIEISRGSGRDPRTVLRYLPWLLTPPSVTQQGPSEFVECVEHVRVLSWILLGALQSAACDVPPVPIESSQHIADQIQFVLAGFAEQSKESVVHMSALFHAFHLCQLWTVYCEQTAANNADTKVGYEALANVMDFWSRVTPAILQLLSHSKVLADMVNLHFLNTIEALQESQSAILTQLYPMWHPILSAYHSVVPSQLRVRLDTYENSISNQEAPLDPWLKRVRFKISQVELQSSAATQFYSV